MLRPITALLTLFVAALAAQSPQDLAIRNVTVVSAAGGPSIPSATVVIRGDRIAVVGQR
jgi:hypothetical protein